MRLLKLLVLASAFVLTPLAFGETFAFYGYAANQVTNGYDGLSVQGTFQATSGFQGLSNVWVITSVTGTVTNPNGSVVSIAGLVPDPGNTPNTAYGFIYDNLFYSAVTPVPSFNPPYPYQDGFDYWGLLFSTSDGDHVNLFTNYVAPLGVVPVYADNNYTYTNNAFFAVSDPSPVGGGPAPGFLVVAAATPEPSSLMLLGTGVLGMAGVVRRKLAAKRK